MQKALKRRDVSKEKKPYRIVDNDAAVDQVEVPRHIRVDRDVG